MKKITTMLLIGVLILTAIGCQMNDDVLVNKELYQTKEPVAINEAVSNLDFKVKLPNNIPFVVNKSEASVFATSESKTQVLQVSYYSKIDQDGNVLTLSLDARNLPDKWDGTVDFQFSNVVEAEKINGNKSWIISNEKETTLMWLDNDVYYTLSNSKGKTGGQYRSFLTIEELREIASSFN